MGKNFIGREVRDDPGVTYAAFPSIEGAVKQLTGVTLPFVDMARGGGLAGLVNNAAVLGEGITKRMSPPAPKAENAWTDAPPPSADRLRTLRDEYLKNQRLRAGQGKSFHPSME